MNKYNRINYGSDGYAITIRITFLDITYEHTERSKSGFKKNMYNLGSFKLITHEYLLSLSQLFLQLHIIILCIFTTTASNTMNYIFFGKNFLHLYCKSHSSFQFIQIWASMWMEYALLNYTTVCTPSERNYIISKPCLAINLMTSRSSQDIPSEYNLDQPETNTDQYPKSDILRSNWEE